ncbi:hypothetical protein EMA8858_00650 [Emticicia aquatica]|jgi:hypothetical protein|uniref:Histidine kinase n=1 Tax=Emticicia aquatica TaxID=1681835 RepID=A0ABN8ENU9_9BACT|nr:histidine kinase [Emticicia aquatica]CAH0994540.1 hypothetical protein EMA8858_00650 [Emticicia aquatica]
MEFRASFAQETEPIILSQNLNYEGQIDGANNTTLFIDSTGKISLKKIHKATFIPLSKFKFQQISTEYSHFNFWLKVTIINPSDSTINLLFNSGVHKSIEVFRKINGQYRSLQLTNQYLLPHQRPYRFDEQYLPLSFEAKQTYELLIKVTEHPQLYFNLKSRFVSYSYEYADKIRAFYDEYIYLVNDGIYISILLFIATYMFILFFTEKKKYYLYYGFYLFFLLLFAFWAIEHSPYIVLIFSYIPALKFSGNNNTYLIITNIFYFLFINDFLELHKIAPKFSRNIIFYVKYLLGSLLIIDTFVSFVLKDYSLGGKIWILTQPLIASMGIYGTIQLYLLKGPFLRYIQIGSTALILGAISGFLEQLLLIKPADNVIMRLSPSFPLNYGVLIEIFCFSMALGYKTWLSQRNRNHLIRSVKESELRTLRAQINPHFVFNSLNSIKGYILKHRQLEAAEYLTDFSTLMRAILQQSKEKFISLNDELQTALLYIKLENLRFEDGFTFTYFIDQNINSEEILTPPMLLQPYLENAIKHGLMSKNSDRILGLSIRKKNEEEIVITIDDNGIGREQAFSNQQNSLKNQAMGMHINNERLQLLGVTNDLHISINVIDKKSTNGNSEGTKVEITLPI